MSSCESSPSSTYPLIVRLTPSRSTLACLNAPQVLYVLAEIMPSQGMGGEGQGRGLASWPLNLCLLIDRSTSMKGPRLAQVKAAVNRLIDALGEADTLSIVTFSDRAEVILPAQRPVNKLIAKGKVQAVHAGGGTEIFHGLMYGLAELYKGREPYSINHLILLTDGRTYGDEEDCLALAQEAAPDGITISALGIGYEWNDDFLDRLAGITGGVSVFIETEEQIVRFLDKHGRTLDAAFAHHLRVQVYMQPGVELKSVFKLVPTPQPLVSDRDTVHLGTVPYGQSMVLLFEFVVQPRPEGYHHLFDLRFSAQIPMEGQGPGAEDGEPGRATDEGQGTMSVQVVCDFAAPFAAKVPQEAPPPRIVAALGQLSLYAMHERALHDVEHGQTTQATRRLQALASRLEHLGQTGLARTALAEADRLQRTGMLSEEGRKRLKYGTRALIAAAPEETSARNGGPDAR